MSGVIGSVGSASAVETALTRAGKKSEETSFEKTLADQTRDPESAQKSWEKRIEAQKKLRLDAERIERAQEGAEQLVAATFIVPILQQLRDSSMAAEPFGPGIYEQRMGPMLDAQIADRIVSAQRLPIVDAIRDRMLGLTRSRVSPQDAEGVSKQGAE